MFDVYKKTVTINNVSYELKPLSGKYLPKLYSLLGQLQGADSEGLLKALDEKGVATMFEVCFETFKASYPQEDVGKIESFVSQNLVLIFPVVVEVNFGDAAKS